MGRDRTTTASTATAAARRGQHRRSLPFSPPFSPTGTSTAPAAPSVCPAETGMCRRSPRECRKPQRDGFIDITQPGISLAMPKGGIKKGGSFADHLRSIAAKTSTDGVVGVARRDGPPRLNAGTGAVRRTRRADEHKQQPSAAVGRSNPPPPPPPRPPRQREPAAKPQRIMERRRRGQEQSRACAAIADPPPPPPQTMQTDKQPEAPLASADAPTQPQIAQTDMQPRVPGTSASADPSPQPEIKPRGVEKRRRPRHEEVPRLRTSAAVNQQAVQQQLASEVQGNGDEDDEDDLLVSQLRLRHLLLRSPKKMKRLEERDTNNSLIAANADSDDELPLFMLKDKKVTQAGAQLPADIHTHGVAPPPLSEDDSGAVGCAAQVCELERDTAGASASATSALAQSPVQPKAGRDAEVRSERQPDGSRITQRSTANYRQSPIAAIAVPSTTRPVRKSRSPVNYNESQLLATRRPIYVDWAGEAGQDPAESGACVVSPECTTACGDNQHCAGTKYAARKEASPRLANRRRDAAPSQSSVCAGIFGKRQDEHCGTEYLVRWQGYVITFAVPSRNYCACAITNNNPFDVQARA
jgi:hypothetical protein